MLPHRTNGFTRGELCASRATVTDWKIKTNGVIVPGKRQTRSKPPTTDSAYLPAGPDLAQQLPSLNHLSKQTDMLPTYTSNANGDAVGKAAWNSQSRWAAHCFMQCLEIPNNLLNVSRIPRPRRLAMTNFHTPTQKRPRTRRTLEHNQEDTNHNALLLLRRNPLRGRLGLLRGPGLRANRNPEALS